MGEWILILLSSIILFLIFPFRITGTVQLYGKELGLKLAVFLFAYNLVYSNYLIQDGRIFRKSKFGAPNKFNIDLGKRGAKRASLALKPKRITFNVLLFNEDAAYLTASALQMLFSELANYLNWQKVDFAYSVQPICAPNNISVYGKCVFSTSILKLLASLIYCTMKDVVKA